MGYRDLVISTVGISLNIVENSVSKELTKGDQKGLGKAREKVESGKQEKIKWMFTQN